jgi:hypothetical protein
MLKARLGSNAMHHRWRVWRGSIDLGQAECDDPHFATSKRPFRSSINNLRKPTITPVGAFARKRQRSYLLLMGMLRDARCRSSRRFAPARSRVQICHTRWKCALVPSISGRLSYLRHSQRPMISVRGDVGGGVEMPKSEADVSADLRDEAGRIDDLARLLADHFGRKVVLVWPDDEEVSG